MTENLLKIDYLKAVTGTIISVNAASCAVRLNTEGTKIGRLYKHNSIAFDSESPFDQLAEYQIGEEITAVPNRAKSYKKNRIVLYYLNERWVDENPWKNLQLKKGDIIFGHVSDAIPDFDAPTAYLVQLDHKHYQKNLPDIEVFLPIDEIPRLDGSPLLLKFDDSIKGIVTNAAFRPPQNPHISIIQARPTELNNQLKALERSHATFFVLGKNQTKLIPEPQKPLRGKHLVLIDDELSPINTFTRAARKLGATVSSLHWKRRFKDNHISSKLSALQESKDSAFDLVIIDDTLGKPTTGLYLLERLAEEHPEWNFILASSFYTPETISKLESSSRKTIAAIHKPVRLASLLEIFEGNSIPREFVKGIEPQLDVQELINKAEVALRSAAGKSNSVEIMAFSLHKGDQLSGIGDNSQRLSHEEKAKWVNDPYFRVLIQNGTGTLQLDRKENPTLAEIILSRNPVGGPTKNFSQWYIGKVESQYLLIGHCFSQKPNLPIELGEWMAEQLARRLWSWHWREAIAPTLALGQQAASVAHELVKYSDMANRRLDSLRNDFEEGDFEKIPLYLMDMEKYLRNSRDTYAALVGSTAKSGEWSFRSAGEEVVNMLKPLCEKQNITIELSFPEISIPCPKAALQLALHNLISNAIKHHFDVDYIDTQEQLLITIIALSDYTHIDIKVQDNGPGIPKHVEEKLFDFGDSFMQSAIKEGEEQSHGIGLWLTQKLLSKFEGELLHTTARGLGTTFTLRLPLTIGEK